MNISIIVYSQTGNTNSVALKLKEKLFADGHSVDLIRLKVSDKSQPKMRVFQFETLPDIGQYDAIMFGSPVEAFSLSPAMKSYLTQITSLKGKKVACFVTKQLPFCWTGGSQAVNRMKKICESKDTTVCGSGIVVWSSKHRERMITDVVEKLSKLF